MHPSASTISLRNSNPRLSSSVERHDLSNFHDRQGVWPLSSAFRWMVRLPLSCTKEQVCQGLPNVYRALASNSTDSSFHLDRYRSRCRRNLAIFTGIRFSSRFVWNLYFSWNLKESKRKVEKGYREKIEKRLQTFTFAESRGRFSNPRSNPLPRFSRAIRVAKGVERLAKRWSRFILWLKPASSEFTLDSLYDRPKEG